ncbi:MAG: SPOR domain-containing protein [Putridiphycobacter sp.]|nr:SPOR domain-containing protein [Putridiphycobacter sp.]
MLKLFVFNTFAQISLEQSIGENITPKSIVADGRGLFSAQNMMYKHTVSIYSSQGTLLKTIHDAVDLHAFGYSEYESAMYRGAPVEACFTPNGKYLWVSNYAMYGPGFENEGCDGCKGDQYDPSFLYKINTLTYQIESVVKVGSVPKYVTITDNGRLLLVSNWTSSDVSIIDLETETEIKRVKVGAHPRGIVVDKWNQKAYVAVMGSDKIAVINLLNYSVRYINHVGKAPRHLILNKANTFLFVAVNSANQLAKVDLITGKIDVCKTNSGPRSMVLSADEKYIYVVNYYANTFQKIDTKQMKVEETVRTFQKPIGIAGDWYNGNIWVSCYSGKIQIFNDAKLTRVENKNTPVSSVYAPKIKMAGLLLNMMTLEAKLESADALTKQTLANDLTNNRHNQTNYAEETNTANDTLMSDCHYALIVGSFSKIENAYYMQALLRTQQLTSQLVPSSNKNMTMVAVSCYNSSHDAMQAAKALKSEHNLNAWIYYK